MFRRIAVAYDESPEAERALTAAIHLAKTLAAELLTITVVEELPAYMAYAAEADSSVLRTLHQDRTEFYEELRVKATALGLREAINIGSHLLNGDKVEGIAGFVIGHNIDLLVIGLHQRSLRVSRMWSTVYSLAQDVPCSVLGVH